MPLHTLLASEDEMSLDDSADDFAAGYASENIGSGNRVLLIVPDGTRTAPVGRFFKALHGALSPRCPRVDVLFALGTHPAMSEEAMLARLELSPAERAGAYADVRLINHAWDDPAALTTLGAIPAEEIAALSGGRFDIPVEVRINRLVLDYDDLVVVGPVFPHEVVGFSGGNKYFFPGISGPEVLNFFHWLGAVITNPMIIGHRWTPVRRVVDRAAALIPTRRHAFCLVVRPDGSLASVHAGSPEEAWEAAAAISAREHIVRRPRSFHTILSCAPPMYDELWVGGKCMYKLEPVLADGGELIIYAPHLDAISRTHGPWIEKIGYHCRDYFLKQWDRFADCPWGVLAHSTHVRGIGTYEDGVENCRVRVTLATALDPALCQRINLGYRDPASIRPEEFADREDEGTLLVRKAGEQLFQLEQPPLWATGESVS